MSTETNTNSIKDHMARLRLKMVQQKIANEKDKLMNRPGTEESTSNDLENQARLQQAMLRRQELLDKIRREQLLNDEAKRPRSYSERRHYTPSPLPVPPSRRSLPDFTRFQYYNPETNRSKADVSQVRHVIEHKIKSPAPPRLPPIAHPTPRPLPPPPGVIIQPPPPPQIMHQPAPQIIQSPPQHVIQQIPQPIVQNLTGQPQESKSMFNKAEFMDMMMMQNAQMHQMMMQQLLLNQTSSGKQSPNAELHQLVMQQLMLNGMGGGSGLLGGGRKKSSKGCRGSSACSGSSGHHGCGRPPPGPCAPPCPPPPPPRPPPLPPPCGPPACNPCPPGSVPRTAGLGNVVHHHYTSPPASQPVHHYTTMPSMEMRAPAIRDYTSAYAGPGYAFSPLDDANNYFYYH